MLAVIDYTSPAWEAIPGDHRLEVRRLAETLNSPPEKGLTAWLKSVALELGISYPAARRHYYNLRNNGGDWTVLIDQRRVHLNHAEIQRTKSHAFAAALVKLVGSYQRKNAPAFRALRRRWSARRVPIPGYEDWPGWPKVPAGWSDVNLARIVRETQDAARRRSIRVGTSSKTNPYLPTVLTTRTGLWPGAVIQLDDVWHDNYVTLGKKREVCRVLELGALDLFSASRFHFGAKPRRRRENGSYETLAMSDMRQFIAGMFHSTGYSPQGTMLMSEHATAKVSEDIARILYDVSRGLIRVEYQPIEGKQAALTGYWPGTEGGNFRAKACLESTHNLIHNDLSHLALQTGSPSSGLLAPVTTDRIVSYISRIVKTVLEKVPHRLELLKLPALDFHTQFFPFLIDYYQFGLDQRTDHDLEGWQALGHVINEYTTIPGSGQYFDEETFLKLPAPSQAIIREAARHAPDQWSRRRNLSPAEVWSRRPKFHPLPPIAFCDILGESLAREVTARRGFLEFSDIEVAPDPLIYTARFCAGPRVGREIPHGEKCLLYVLPFADHTAILVDAKHRYLGEVPLYKRVTPVDPDAFGSSAPYESRPEIKSPDLLRAAGEKHSRIADILAPERHLHADTVQSARSLRAHNRDLIHSDEIAETRRMIQEGRAAVSSGLMADDALDLLPKTPDPTPTSDGLDF